MLLMYVCVCECVLRSIWAGRMGKSKSKGRVYSYVCVCNAQKRASEERKKYSITNSNSSAVAQIVTTTRVTARATHINAVTATSNNTYKNSTLIKIWLQYTIYPLWLPISIQSAWEREKRNKKKNLMHTNCGRGQSIHYVPWRK